MQLRFKKKKNPPPPPKKKTPPPPTIKFKTKTNGKTKQLTRSMCCTHLQMFSVSTVLGEKASDVEQSWRAGAKLPGRRPQAHWTGRGPVNEGIMFGHLKVLLFLFLFWGVCTGVWAWICEWMSLQCHSCAQILDRGERCLGRDLQYPRKRHQVPHVRVTGNQPGELLKPGRKTLLWRLLERPLLSGNVCVEDIYKSSLSVLSLARRPLTWSSPEEHLLSFLTVAHHHIGQERTTKGRRHVWWVEGFALWFSSVHGLCGWMCEWMSFRCHSCAWRKMSSDWSPLSVITTSSGTTCPSRLES